MKITAAKQQGSLLVYLGILYINNIDVTVKVDCKLQSEDYIVFPAV